MHPSPVEQFGIVVLGTALVFFGIVLPLLRWDEARKQAKGDTRGKKSRTPR